MMSTGFMVNFMLKANLSLAIVDMTQNKTNTTTANDDMKFNWTNTEKNYLVQITTVGYFLFEIIGPIWADKMGSKKVFGCSTILASISTLLFPLACYTNYYVTLCARIVLGMGLGSAMTSWSCLSIKWFSSSDRCKSISTISTSAIGVTISMLLSGYIISYFGWPSVFYTIGTLGFLWSLLWFYLVFDGPEEHPRISFNEKLKILNNIKNDDKCVGKRPDRIPWFKIMTSVRVWAILITQFSAEFTIFTFITQMPTYLNEILELSITDIGIWSCLPFIGKKYNSNSSNKYIQCFII